MTFFSELGHAVFQNITLFLPEHSNASVRILNLRAGAGSLGSSGSTSSGSSGWSY